MRVSRGGGPQPLQQLRRGLAVAVVVGLQESGQPLLAQTAGVHRAGIAGQERKRDRAVDVSEQSDGAGPEPLKFCAQLVGQRDPGGDEILTRARQRPQRLGLIQVGLQQPEAMPVGARQLAEHEPVEAIGLPARGAKPITRRLDLNGVKRQDPHAGLQ